MRLKKLLVGAFFLSISMSSLAAVDYKCQQDCTSQGYMYNYCTKICTY